MSPLPPGIELVAVRTPTLPPATHTNCWIVGQGDLVVVDPASPWEDEQGRLFTAVLDRVERGERVASLLLTHHHADHVSGAIDLQRRLNLAGHRVPIAAHPVTAALLEGHIQVEMPVAHGDAVTAGGRRLRAIFTPGHAPGHLALHDRDSGAMIAGDMVAGVGTIAIDPDEGDLQDYLDSLQRLIDLQPSTLLPAHGPALPHAHAVLSFYIAHRHSRTEQVRTALDHAGRATALALAPTVYPELATALYPLAARQITTHLNWLQANGRVRAHADGRWTLE